VADGYAAIVLAGGDGRRLGGRDKPALPVGGRPMLQRVLDAAADAAPRVVVGPTRPDLPVDVVQIREDPPGGGPVAALAAGLAALSAHPTGRRPEFVALLAADLPFLAAPDIGALRYAVGDDDGAVLVDTDGRQQWLCGVYRVAALHRRLGEFGPPGGAPMHRLASGLRLVTVERSGTTAPPPWYDCDTEDDYRQAEELA
jgi:molybdopterin-guanine dinucleotide biosynthesis protein A